MLTPKIIGVEALEDYKIKLNYETGEIKLFDVSPYISGVWYNELTNYSYFKTVHIISSGNGIEWEHGQDIAPHELYDMSVSVCVPCGLQAEHQPA
jgi:hypothetical protein